MASDKPGFLAELKRRNVLRAAVLYAGAVWALSQGVSQLSPALGLPDYATRWFLIAAVIGFPFWLTFAWFYEFTPHGFKRESEVAIDAPQRHSNARKLDFTIIGVMALAIALLASGYFVRRGQPPVAMAAAAPAKAAVFNPPADTLVVLPFANLSGDASQQYFSDGITEELTNALGQTTGLKVIAWDTASHYRDSREPATAIGRALDVANVLTGKILKRDNTVRVIVELVSARTGFQVWADHYDDSLANVFQVQDKISGAIAGALKVKFASLGAAATVNPQAHDLVLKARALVRKARTAAPYEQAKKLYEQAIVLAPDYADAHSGLARMWFDLSQYSTLPLKDALLRARTEANKALALDPRNVDALIALANVDATEGKTAEAKVLYERALTIDPSDAYAHLGYGTVLPLHQALAQEQEAVQLDPDNATAQNNLASYALDSGEYAQALAPWQATVRLDPTSADSVLQLALTYTLLHRPADAVKAFDLAQPKAELAKAIIAAGRLTYQSALDPALHAKARAAVAELGQRTDLDPYAMIDVLQLELTLGENAPALEQLPTMCASSPAACSDLSVNPLWVPLRGQPRFDTLVKQYDTVSKPAPVASAQPPSPSVPRPAEGGS
ncbi:MAG TPA: tetratricopeptide repeat protein [Rhodanobacteraceae bacterium]